MRSSPQDTRSNRSVYGAVHGSGSILVPGSSDWTVIKTAVGTYQIHINPPFKKPPVVVGAAISLSLFYLITYNIDLIQINMYAVSTAGTLQDGGFSFKAEGN